MRLPTKTLVLGPGNRGCDRSLSRNRNYKAELDANLNAYILGILG